MLSHDSDIRLVRPPRTLDHVKGWFPVLDQVLFDWFLDRQESTGLRGDLLEVGVYKGKSAIFSGRHLREGERYTVCDLFEGDAPDDANRAESAKSYSALTRRVFGENYSVCTTGSRHSRVRHVRPWARSGRATP